MLHDIHVIACGESHVAMLTKEGKIFVCGAGENGRLGTGNEDDRYGDNALCTTCKCLINTHAKTCNFISHQLKIIIIIW